MRHILLFPSGFGVTQVPSQVGRGIEFFKGHDKTLQRHGKSPRHMLQQEGVALSVALSQRSLARQAAQRMLHRQPALSVTRLGGGASRQQHAHSLHLVRGRGRASTW